MRYTTTHLFTIMAALATGWGAREYTLPEPTMRGDIERWCQEKGADCGAVVLFKGDDIVGHYASFLAANGKGALHGEGMQGSWVCCRRTGTGYAVMFTDRQLFDKHEGILLNNWPNGFTFWPYNMPLKEVLEKFPNGIPPEPEMFKNTTTPGDNNGQSSQKSSEPDN